MNEQDKAEFQLEEKLMQKKISDSEMLKDWEEYGCTSFKLGMYVHHNISIEKMDRLENEDLWLFWWNATKDEAWKVRRVFGTFNTEFNLSDSVILNVDVGKLCKELVNGCYQFNSI